MAGDSGRVLNDGPAVAWAGSSAIGGLAGWPAVGSGLLMRDYRDPATAPSGPKGPKPEPNDNQGVSLTLPNPRHAQRVPPHIGKEQLDRIRQAAYMLPQVVKPADYVAERSAGFEEHLDKLGLVLLQKAVAGARPSRWIAPELMDSALAHLDAVGSGPTVRPLMLERSAALEALGVARQAGGLDAPDQPHACRCPRPAGACRCCSACRWTPQPVWAFYRSGDQAALLAGARRAAIAYPQAAELTAHLEAWSRAAAPTSRATSNRCCRACSRNAPPPQPLPELKAACTRAQDRWEHRVAELDTLEGLNSELAFQGYPDTFETARHLQRSVTLYVGPPNSGKTHAAFERLAQALDGAYLAPLRLLALEGRDRLVARGVPCSLLTGEENVPADGARVVSQHDRDGRHATSPSTWR